MNKYTVLSLVCLAISVPLAWLLLQRKMVDRVVPVVRFAVFNASLHRDRPGALQDELRGGRSEQARRIAEIVQRCDVDVLLLCELDRDAAGEAAELLATQYLAVSQNGARPIDFAFRYVPEVNTGEPTGLDLDRDGRSDGPGDAFGFGSFPGQYGMALLSRHPIVTAGIRTFRMLPWSAMPGAMRPAGYYDDATWARLRLSSKNHVDVPIRCGGTTVHVLCSHPTPPAFDGPEDRNGCRNHDEIRFWCDYLTPGSGWIVDDAGAQGGLAPDQPFVLMGDLNCDPLDGDARAEALQRLLAIPRLRDLEPRSDGGGAQAAIDQWAENSRHRGDAALDTGDFADAPGEGPGNLRVDYVLPSREPPAYGRAVFWPKPGMPGAALVGASDHRLVWVDVAAH